MYCGAPVEEGRATEMVGGAPVQVDSEVKEGEEGEELVLEMVMSVIGVVGPVLAAEELSKLVMVAI